MPSLVLLLLVLEVGHAQWVFLPPPVSQGVLLLNALGDRHLFLADWLVAEVVHARQQGENALVVIEIQSEVELVGFIGLGGLGPPHHRHLQLEQPLTQTAALQLNVHHLNFPLPPLLLLFVVLVPLGSGGTEHGHSVAGEGGCSLHGPQLCLEGLGGEPEQAVEQTGVLLYPDWQFGDADGFLWGRVGLHGCYYTLDASFQSPAYQLTPDLSPYIRCQSFD